MKAGHSKANGVLIFHANHAVFPTFFTCFISICLNNSRQINLNCDVKKEKGALQKLQFENSMKKLTVFQKIIPKCLVFYLQKNHKTNFFIMNFPYFFRKTNKSKRVFLIFLTLFWHCHKKHSTPFPT